MGKLRVISGKAKGRKLASVPGKITRPITDRVKEALFNIISVDIRDSSMLDLFAGTGSVGIEALSRGAKFVRFIDKHRLAIKTINSNLETTKLSNWAETLLVDAFTLLDSKSDRQFDYVFIAPPQYKGLWIRALQTLDNNINWLADGAWIIVQIDPIEDKEIQLINLVEFDRRKYGSTLLIFMEFIGKNGE
jgi:16S rRNA (guanine966-N2)-methyltransferase